MGLSSLALRLARLESRSTDTFKLIVVTGGFHDGICHAIAGDSRWDRDDGEEFDMFVERARAAAIAGGHDLCVIGGLS